ncbi:MAG: hypothetical protein K8H84_07665 [Sulfuricella denitrificans]|nr:hypothetical protein [Sulfuricella denitrificans]
MSEHYRDLAEQLAAMPGGHTRLREEYFDTVTLPDPLPCHISSSTGEIIGGWMLQGEEILALVSAENGDVPLIWLRQDGEELIATFPPALQKAASDFSILPLGLALLALAMGSEDDSRLRKLLPELHKAGKGLLLVAVCRLCG